MVSSYSLIVTGYSFHKSLKINVLKNMTTAIIYARLLKPIYGCYLQGKFWVFTTLHDNNYCVSRAYDATQIADLHKIIFILKELKHIILTELS